MKTIRYVLKIKLNGDKRFGWYLSSVDCGALTTQKKYAQSFSREFIALSTGEMLQEQNEGLEYKIKEVTA